MTSSSDKDFEFFNSKVFSLISKQNADKNLFLSPTSVALSLSMCTMGARKETLDQMLTAFGVANKGDLRSIIGTVTNVFKATSPDASQSQASENNSIFNSSSKVPVDLRLVNRIYVQNTFSIEENYAEKVRRRFLSEIISEDFIAESEKAIENINQWVEDKTNKRISNIVSNADISPSTTFVLINCIYFKGEWQNKFQEKHTDKNADFHQSNGTISKIELMFHKEYHNYLDDSDLGVQVAHLLYKSASDDSQFVFTVVLPKEGVKLEEVQEKLMSNLELKQNILNIRNAESKELTLYVPKFKIQAKYDFSDVATSLGMTDAFDNTKANFKGITGEVSDEHRIWISKVLHKTFVDVNEDGTEAAATGAVIMERFGSALGTPIPPIEFKANRPFLFFIQEVKFNIIIFSGKFVTS